MADAISRKPIWEGREIHFFPIRLFPLYALLSLSEDRQMGKHFACRIVKSEHFIFRTFKKIAYLFHLLCAHFLGCRRKKGSIFLRERKPSLS